MASKTYAIYYKKSIAKDLKAIALPERRLIVAKILSLATDPHPIGSVKLQGAARLYRVRQGDYRIIYSVEKGKLMVLVIKVGHRREVYR